MAAIDKIFPWNVHPPMPAKLLADGTTIFFILHDGSLVFGTIIQFESKLNRYNVLYTYKDPKIAYRYYVPHENIIAIW
jgi:hypothetical protein